MTLADLEEGSAVFVDANVFVYHFVGASAEWRARSRVRRPRSSLPRYPTGS